MLAKDIVAAVVDVAIAVVLTVEFELAKGIFSFAKIVFNPKFYLFFKHAIVRFDIFVFNFKCLLLKSFAKIIFINFCLLEYSLSMLHTKKILVF